MTADDLQRTLAEPMTQERFRTLSALIQGQPLEEVFALLWPIALDADTIPADQWASYLLVELEPRCPIECVDALRGIAMSRLNLGNRLVPFYLMTQFGKRTVAQAYREVVANFPGDVPPELSGIRYWLSAPAVELIGSYYRWRNEE